MRGLPMNITKDMLLFTCLVLAFTTTAKALQYKSQRSNKRNNESTVITAFLSPAISFAKRHMKVVLSSSSSTDDTSPDSTQYLPNGMPILPTDVIKYSQVPKKGWFTTNNIPKGLLRQHSTKAGTWGIIRVYRGLLEYRIENKNDTDGDNVFGLDSEHSGVIEPQRLHSVKSMSDDLQFAVEFHRLPGTGPVVEEREGL